VAAAHGLRDGRARDYIGGRLLVGGLPAGKGQQIHYGIINRCMRNDHFAKLPITPVRHGGTYTGRIRHAGTTWHQGLLVVIPGDKTKPVQWSTQRRREDRRRTAWLPGHAIDIAEAMCLGIRKGTKRSSETWIEGCWIDEGANREVFDPCAEASPKQRPVDPVLLWEQ
jgi:hypothetical protein